MASGPAYAKHPEHTVDVESASGRVRVTRGGLVLADSDRALILREASYPPVAYLPREHISLEAMEPETRITHCPFKGDASYFTITGGGEPVAGGAWSYEAPYDEVADIAGHVAFYPEHVSIEGVES